MKTLQYIFSTLLAVGVFGGAAKGADLSWLNAGVGEWENTGNWGGSVPSFSDNVFIENSGTANIGTGVAAEAAALNIGLGAVTVSSGTLTVTDSITVSVNASFSVVDGVVSAGNIMGAEGGSSLSLQNASLRALGSTSLFLSNFNAVILGGSGVSIDTNGFDLEVGTALDGSGGLVKTGDGALTLNAFNTYMGPTGLSQGTLRVGSAASLGTGIFTIGGGTFGNAASDEIAAIGNDMVVLDDFSIDVLGQGGAMEIFGDVDMGTVSLRTITLTNEGLACFGGTITAVDLTFVTTGTYSQVMFCSDTTNDISGTLRIGSGVQLELWKDSGAIAITGNLLIDAGAQALLIYYDQFGEESHVEVNGLLQGQTSGTNVVNSISGTGTVNGLYDGETFAINSGTFGGNVTDGDGTVAVIKQGEGILAFSGSNGYSRGTAIKAGTLRAESNRALGSGAVTVERGGTLHVIENTALETGVITLESDGTAIYRKDFAANETLANFNALQSNGSEPSQAEILAGTASENLSVSASFSETPDIPVTNDQFRLTDVFSLSGPEGELFVMQLSFNQDAYDAAFLAGLIESKLELFLGYLEGDTWTKVSTGPVVDGAWNSSYMTLGTYGVDSDNNTVWAVTNKEGDISVVPEPSTWLLLGLGLGVLRIFRRVPGRE